MSKTDEIKFINDHITIFPSDKAGVLHEMHIKNPNDSTMKIIEVPKEKPLSGSIKRQIDRKQISRHDVMSMLNIVLQQQDFLNHAKTQYKTICASYDKAGGLFPLGFVQKFLNISKTRLYKLIASGEIEKIDGFKNSWITYNSINKYLRTQKPRKQRKKGSSQ